MKLIKKVKDRSMLENAINEVVKLVDYKGLRIEKVVYIGKNELEQDSFIMQSDNTNKIYLYTELSGLNFDGSGTIDSEDIILEIISPDKKDYQRFVSLLKSNKLWKEQ